MLIALNALHLAETENKHVTGLLYFDSTKPSATEDQNLSSTPLSEISDDLMRPNESSLDTINSRFRA